MRPTAEQVTPSRTPCSGGSGVGAAVGGPESCCSSLTFPAAQRKGAGPTASCSAFLLHLLSPKSPSTPPTPPRFPLTPTKVPLRSFLPCVPARCVGAAASCAFGGEKYPKYVKDAERMFSSCPAAPASFPSSLPSSISSSLRLHALLSEGARSLRAQLSKTRKLTMTESCERSRKPATFCGASVRNFGLKHVVSYRSIKEQQNKSNFHRKLKNASGKEKLELSECIFLRA